MTNHQATGDEATSHGRGKEASAVQVVRDFRKLAVWEKSHALTLGVYKVTASFPRDERYGLSGQIRRACVSIPANIAEGCGRTGDAEFGRFLQVAMGSASELEYHLLLAKDLGFVDLAAYSRLHTGVAEVKRMLSAFLRRLKATPDGPPLVARRSSPRRTP